MAREQSCRQAAVSTAPVSRRGGASALVLVTVLALVAAACSRSGTGNTSAGSTATTAATAATAATFGSMKEPVCGPKPAGETNVGGQRGLSPTQIEVGTISDPGYSGAPGLNQELFDASTVFTKWCNSLGGINGRLIKDDQLDAAVLNYNAQIETGCNQDFALVGGGGVLDDTGQKTRLSCMLPDYPGYLVSPEARGADLAVQVTPGPNNSLNFGVARYLAEKFPDSVDKIGYLTGNVATTVTNKNQYEEAGQKLGFGKAVYDGQYNSLGESNWTPIAQAIKSAGTKGLYFIGEPSDFSQLISALASIDYKLDWISAAANQYDPKTITGAGAALNYEPVYVAVSTTPFESTSVPAIKQYEALFNQYQPASTRKKAALGLNSFSAWLLFAQSVKSCGGNPTPKCVYDAASKVSTWDGGGLQAPSNPSDGNQASPCITIMKASSTGWTSVPWPPTTDGFNCAKANVVPLTGDYGTGTKLSDVGKSMSDLP
jgi:ABC-type branched-subunit amino acid transport system substrate-binding protein